MKIRIALCVYVRIDYIDMKTLDNSGSGHKSIKSLTNCKKVNKEERTMANKGEV